MQILAIERELREIDSVKQRVVLREEAAAVWALRKREVVREIWFTRADTRAVVLLECADEEEAMRHLSALPLVRDGFIAFEVHGLRPYDGLDRLVAP